MKYFENCKTAEELKKAYHKAAARLHPDNGGSEEEFKKMQAEYMKAFDRLKNIHTNAAGETYEKETSENAADYMEIINKVIHLEGVNIEIIGSWIWLSGNTMEYKEEIKAAGFWWSKNKKAWYYNGDDKKSRRRGRYSMDQLREKWGTEEVKKTRQERITA